MLGIKPRLDPLSEGYHQVIDDLCDLSETHLYKGQLDQALHLLQIGDTLVNNREVEESKQAKLHLQVVNLLTVDHFVRGTPTLPRIIELLDHIAQLSLSDQQTALILHFRAMPIYWTALKDPDEKQRFAQMDDALALFEQALEGCQTANAEAASTLELFWIGLVKQHQHRLEEAHTLFTQVLQLAHQHHDDFHQAEANHHLGVVNQYQGNLDLAQQHLEQAIKIRERIGLKIYLPFEYNSLGRVYGLGNNVDDAHVMYTQAYQLAKAMDFKGPMMFAQLYKGLLYKDQSDFMAAQIVLKEALSLAQIMEDQRAITGIAGLLDEIAGEL